MTSFESFEQHNALNQAPEADSLYASLIEHVQVHQGENAPSIPLVTWNSFQRTDYGYRLSARQAWTTLAQFVRGTLDSIYSRQSFNRTIDLTDFAAVDSELQLVVGFHAETFSKFAVTVRQHEGPQGIDTVTVEFVENLLKQIELESPDE